MAEAISRLYGEEMGRKLIDQKLHATTVVVRHKGREVGRMSAATRSASERIAELSRQYGTVQVEYLEEECVDLLELDRRR